MKKLPIGIQTFSELIEENYVYVDKTEQIHRLVTTGKYYFLSRPRRFGKSLLCSTLKSLFEGKRELFKNLWIGRNSEYQWSQHPIIHIDFNTIAHETIQELKESLVRTLNDICLTHKLTPLVHSTPGEMLKRLTSELFEKYSSKVVLIIDEYDKPILRYLHDVELARNMRDTLKSFYEFIKGLDEKLRFVFITGVSKFSKTSIFSGFNNLNDLSLDERSATLLGYKHDEINAFFHDHLQHATEKLKLSHDELLEALRAWYDGYFFESEASPTNEKKVYNPFSILFFFDKLKFSNYWFASGTPTFLINLIKANDYPLPKFEAIQMTESEFGNFDVGNIPLNTLLFQTGYMTIKAYDANSRNYTLSYPNKETTDSLIEYLFASMTGVSGTQPK